MLRDRGTIKWNSLMLPEHVQILKEMWKEDEKQVAPELDDQALEELNDQCLEAYQENNVVTITQFKKGSFRSDKGTITKLLPQEQSLRFTRVNGTSISIPIQHIVHLENES